MTDQDTLEKIADMLRELYPKAASVTFFVNHQECEVSVKYRNKLDGISMRSLDGEWIEERGNSGE